MRIAFTTSTGVEIDEHFRKTKRFTIWDVEPLEAYYVTLITVDTGDRAGDDGIGARADALAGCAMVFTREITGPAVARLVARNIQPVKTHKPVRVEEIIDRLQVVMRGTPPPWIRKQMLHSGG